MAHSNAQANIQQQKIEELEEKLRKYENSYESLYDLTINEHKFDTSDLVCCNKCHTWQNIPNAHDTIEDYLEFVCSECEKEILNCEKCKIDIIRDSEEHNLCIIDNTGEKIYCKNCSEYCKEESEED